ncbi:Mating type 1-1-2 protein [Fusarium oxysporum f. sp. albedinis]|nr:Mating type 1-1-2 protein [Fusarium oxysporum f. sp. albedinis]
MLTEFISQGFLPENPLTHLCPSRFYQTLPTLSSSNNVTNTNTRKLQRLCNLANLVARHPHRLHALLDIYTARRYLASGR